MTAEASIRSLLGLTVAHARPAFLARNVHDRWIVIHQAKGRLATVRACRERIGGVRLP
jgi:hypothetical protein